jgi:hypothetical protein
MTYAVRDLVGAQPIAENSTVQVHVLGTKVKAWDPTYGEGEFIYLKGVVSTVVGSIVTYNALSGATVLADGANLAQPVAVAMSACVASEFGWYQIKGAAVIKKTTVAVNPNVVIFLSATAGRIKVLASAGRQILGARTANAATVVSTTSTVVVTIEYPHAQGQVT